MVSEVRDSVSDVFLKLSCRFRVFHKHFSCMVAHSSLQTTQNRSRYLLPLCRSGKVQNHENPETWWGAGGFLDGSPSSYALFPAATGLSDG